MVDGDNRMLPGIKSLVVEPTFEGTTACVIVIELVSYWGMSNMKNPSGQRFSQSVRQAVRIATRRFRYLGMDQTGSVVAAGIVILGIFTVMFAAGVRHEGSAQELDIFTAHRRKALDLARGGIDRLLMEFSKENDVNDCTTGDLPAPDYQSTLKAIASKDGSGVARLTSSATVGKARETVTVTLEPSGGGLFAGLFGKRTLASGGTVHAKNHSTGSVDSPVYYPGEVDRETHAKIAIPESEGTVDVPAVDRVKSAVLARLSTTGIVYGKKVSTIPSGTITQNTLVTASQQLSGTREINVAAGACLAVSGGVSFRDHGEGTLVINGDLHINNGSLSVGSHAKVDLILNGDLIINNGSLTVGTHAQVDLVLNGNIVVLGGGVTFQNHSQTSIVGRGMIIAVPSGSGNGIEASNHSTLTIGESGAGTTNLSLITTGTVDLDNHGDVYGSLLLYGKDIYFSNHCVVEAGTASVVSPGSIEFGSHSAVTLRRGDFEDWEDQPDLEGEAGEYRIVGWEEGNHPD